ncbi:MAG: type 1 glutamine amidotransferase [Verrucomicrobiota bacterium]
MKIACLQNFAPEGPARIADWAVESGHELHLFLAPEGPVIPSDSYDAFVIMGGPMSANDALDNPDVAFALDQVREFIDSGKPVLGICLGAQMIALAIGGEVAPGPQSEIGWFPVFRTEETDHFLDELPEETTIFHWHGEQILLPPGARLLASSRICPVQAFQYGDKCLGLQCHLEVNELSLTDFLRVFADEVEEGGPTVQTSMEMIEGFATHGDKCEGLLFRMLDRWIES